MTLTLFCITGLYLINLSFKPLRQRVSGHKEIYAMVKNLRKIAFKHEANGFCPDLTEQEQKEQEEREHLRDGFFHTWCKMEETSPQSGNFIEVTYALVEDCETGKTHYILPEFVTFIN